jgi:hypothetical protein
MNIQIVYDGKYPNLCSGKLIVKIDYSILEWNKTYNFPVNCLISCGTTIYSELKNNGYKWKISSWPDDFPEELKLNVLEAVNKQIPLGCCGGCL